MACNLVTGVSLRSVPPYKKVLSATVLKYVCIRDEQQRESLLMINFFILNAPCIIRHQKFQQIKH